MTIHVTTSLSERGGETHVVLRGVADVGLVEMLVEGIDAMRPGHGRIVVDIGSLEQPTGTTGRALLEELLESRGIEVAPPLVAPPLAALPLVETSGPTTGVTAGAA